MTPKPACSHLRRPFLAALMVMAPLPVPASAQTPAPPADRVPATQPATNTPTPAGHPSPATLATPAPAIAVQLPRDLSPWGMFMNADIVVKAVMVGLAFASVLSWTIWLAKTLELMAARARLRRALTRAQRHALAGRRPGAAPGRGRRSARFGASRRPRIAAIRRRAGGRRRQGARRLAALAHRGHRRPAHDPRHRHGLPPSAPPRPSSGCSAPCGAS